MIQKIQISGMTCGGCEGSVVRIASDLPGFIQAKADRHTSKLELETTRDISLEEVKAIFQPFPKYAVEKAAEPESTFDFAQYEPLLLIFFFISLVAVLSSFHMGDFSLENWNLKKVLHNFMTGFFLVFSFFKLLDVKSFAASFKNYDIVAAQIPAYGYIYPYLELFLGVSCLIFFNATWLYVFDIVLMGIGLVGVIKSNLEKKEIQCACLGTVFNLPMSKITIIENTIMILVGAILLII
jgi:copper chaperone CopZ